MTDNRKTCFVIMPIGKTSDEHSEEYWQVHYDTFLKPLIEENPNLKAERSEALRGDILREIITNLVVACVVVADLTDSNCNVYWELGVRQSFKHCTITIAETLTKIPFDIFAKGTLYYYPNNYIKNAKFRAKFKEALQDCLTKPNRPDSHVLETLSGRGTLFEIFRRDEATRRLEALISECAANLNLFETTVKRAKKNIECRKSKSTTEEPRAFSSYLSLLALDLLTVERYVEEDQEFYDKLHNVRMWYIWFNDMIREWDEPRMAEMDNRFIDCEKEGLDCILVCLDLAERAREKVGKLL